MQDISDHCLPDSYSIVRYDGKVLISMFSPDWWILRRAVHDGEEGWRPYHGKYSEHICYEWYDSSRLSGCDIEGGPGDFEGMMLAIQEGRSYDATRCAVSPYEDGFLFWSPRNDKDVVCLVPMKHALDLASQIKTLLDVWKTNREMLCIKNDEVGDDEVEEPMTN